MLANASGKGKSYFTDFFMSTLFIRLSVFGFLICCVLFLGACASSNNNANETPVISGQPKTTLPMPPLNGKSLQQMGWELSDGKHDVFSEYKGKVLVLDFYATWCEPCRDSIPHLVELQRRYENEVRVVGLNVGGPDDVDQVSDFARRFAIQYPLALPDQDLATFLLAGSDAIPQTFIFDRQGELVHRFVGFGEDTAKEIDRAIEIALQSAAD
jgi:thiol-disulfide isomerase/thioredoxin